MNEIEEMRTFVQLRSMLANNNELSRRLDQLEANENREEGKN